MNIVILTKHAFPVGLAHTNRIIALGKGLIANGHKVTVVITKPTELKNGPNKLGQGVYDGIKYEYAGGDPFKSKGLFSRLKNYPKFLKDSINIIEKTKTLEGVDAIISGNIPHLFCYYHYKFAKRNRIKFFQERSEYPFLSFRGFLGKVKLWFYLRFVCKWNDGMILITKALQKYFQRHLRKGLQSYLLPILVEPERFENSENDRSFEITYCGSMHGDKDGVPILIESFAQIHHEFPEYKLKLIGDIQFPGFTELERKVQSLKINEKVDFTGKVHRDQLPKMLAKADVLALARPNNKQAEGGFPTKLGEYLATGKPAVVTRVGELEDFLKDEVNAFISEPDSVEAFAEKLKTILKFYESAQRIGKNGYELTLKEFNYKVQAQKLVDWIETQ